MSLSNYRRWQNPSDNIYFGTSWELRDGQLDLAVYSDKAITHDGKTNKFGYKLITNGMNRNHWGTFYQLKTLGGFDSDEGVPHGKHTGHNGHGSSASRIPCQVVYPKTAAEWKPCDNLGKSVRSSVFHKYMKQ